MCLDLKRLPGCRALCSAYELGMFMAASSHKLAYLTEATVFTSVSPVLMGVDALHQLKTAIFKKCVCGVCGSEARVGSPGAGVVTYLTRVLEI